MSQVLKRLIENRVRPLLSQYEAEAKERALSDIQALVGSAGGTATLPDDVGKEFDRLVYDIIIPSVAEALQQYLRTNVRVSPGQLVQTAGTAAAQSGQTTTPGNLIVP